MKKRGYSTQATIVRLTEDLERHVLVDLQYGQPVDVKAAALAVHCTISQLRLPLATLFKEGTLSMVQKLGTRRADKSFDDAVQAADLVAIASAGLSYQHRRKPALTRTVEEMVSAQSSLQEFEKTLQHRQYLTPAQTYDFLSLNRRFHSVIGGALGHPHIATQQWYRSCFRILLNHNMSTDETRSVSKTLMEQDRIIRLLQEKAHCQYLLQKEISNHLRKMIARSAQTL